MNTFCYDRVFAPRKVPIHRIDFSAPSFVFSFFRRTTHNLGKVVQEMFSIVRDHSWECEGNERKEKGSLSGVDLTKIRIKTNSGMKCKHSTP